MPGLLAGLLLTFLGAAAHAAPISDDPSLAINQVVSGLTEPTAMAFLADGDFLILEKSAGKVRRVTNGVLNPTAVLDLDVEGCDERGLLGIALHPLFAENHYVYLYYNPSLTTGDTADCLYFAGYFNQVDRFLWDPNGNGGAGSLTLDTADILHVHSDVPYHNGGSISFGPDGKLYGVIGDGGHNDLFSNGKLQNDADGGDPDDTGIVFRLNDDGTNPGDNPFAGISGMEKVFAYGIRNSFGITWDPMTGDLWESENGEDDYDEVNRIPAGMNGGWADIMGPDSRDPQNVSDLFAFEGSAYSDPEFSWQDVVAPTGIAFGGSALGGCENDLFVGDYNNGLLYRFEPNGGRTALSLSGGLSDLVADSSSERDSLVVAEGFGFGLDSGGGISDLETGPDGAVYVVSIGNGTVDQVTGTAGCGGGGGGPAPHDLAVSTVKAPKKISLSEKKPVVMKGLKVTIVNQGGDTETIDDLGELMDLVSIDWTSLGECPAPSTGLVPPKQGFPVVLATKKKLNLAYDVTWDCPNDPEQSSKDADHSDFQVEVSVDHSALGGGADADPSDDVCPRPASGDDKGCGGKDENGDIGGAIRTDVIVK